MTKYRLYLLGAVVLAVLLSVVGDYSFMDWEFYVLGAPYIVLGAVTT